jgi:hypothetical protein
MLLFAGSGDPPAAASTGSIDAAQGFGPVACGGVISDGCFEAQGLGWTQRSAHGHTLIHRYYPRTGQWGALLGGANDAEDGLSQQIDLPADKIITVLAWWAVATEEPGVGFDRLTLSALRPDGALLRDLWIVDSSAAANQWDLAEADLTPYAGQTVTLRLRAITNGSSPTDFYVDDVSIAVRSAALRLYLPAVLR